MKKEKLFLLLVVILAFFLRVFRITQAPPSLSWDEAAVGYNAYSIWKTGKDEFAQPLPFSFKSFGDYKSPLLIYLTVPFVGLLGLNEFAVRFPSAFFGTLTVLVIYLLTKELFKEKKELEIGNWKLEIGLIAGFLLAISPWHLQFSRVAFEPNLALFFIVLGVWLFLKALKRPIFYLLSSISYLLSLYSYHSPKLFLPLFLLILTFIYRKQIFKKQNFGYLFLTLILGLILVFPLLKTHLGGEAGARFTGTSIFYDKEEKLRQFNFQLVKDIGRNYFVDYSPQFLFFGNEENLRNKMKEIGLLYLIEAPFLLIGLYTLIKQRKEKWAKLLLTWLLLAPIPAMIGIEAPHSLRTLNMLPALIIVIAIAIGKFLGYIRRLGKKKMLFFCFLFSVFCFLNIIYYLYTYHFRYPVYAAKDWQYGYKQMAQYVETKEDEVEKIIITTSYGQPYIFIQFFQKLEPMQLWQEKIDQYQFRDINWEQDKNLKNVLIVATDDEVSLRTIASEVKIKKEIYFPDGSVAFRIIRL